MNFTDLHTTMMDLLADPEGSISYELISAPGRGKSSFVKQLREALSQRDGEQWGFASMFLSTMTPADLWGLPWKGELDYEGTKINVVDPSMPRWMITDDNKPVWAYSRGILLLDEFGQGQTDVKAGSAELVLNKMLGTWKLPEGWVVIACSNRTSDRSGVTKSLDFVINRRMEIHVTDHMESLLAWMDKNGVHPFTKVFTRNNPEVVLSSVMPEKQGPWCTPRSMVMFDAQLTRLGKARQRRAGIESDFVERLPNDGIAMEMGAGLIGNAATEAYMSQLMLREEMPEFEEILKAPKTAKVPDAPDVQMLTVYTLAHRIDEKNCGPVLEYVDRMPKDFAMTFVTSVVGRVGRIVATPAFAKWIKSNQSLVVALGGQR